MATVTGNLYCVRCTPLLTNLVATQCIANFEHCAWSTTDCPSNADLENLGDVVLECMNGSPSEALLNPVKVRRLEESNKIFGLEDRET
jgi:hypothetical protein